MSVTSLAFSVLLACPFLGYVVNAYSDAALADQIVALPGAPENLAFNQFSGYLTINPETGKNIHYWLVESEVDPANAPVVFWTNGGPGCSGLLGFFTEQGPFRPQADGTLKLNDYAWNKIANMVFVEQPTGVGFSYSEDTSDYKLNDKIAAQDNYLIIQEFLKRFPEYSENIIYSSAESYGGHYMPQLAAYVLEQNADPASPYPKLNYKGFAVGNPFTDQLSEYPAMFYTYWGHQLISKPSWDRYLEQCVNVPVPDRNYTVCEMIEIQLGMEIQGLNPYALDYPTCTESSTRGRGSRAQLTWALNFMLPDHLKTILAPSTLEGYEPCSSDYTVTYLNRDDVKASIHVDSSIVWEECSRTIHYTMIDRLIPMQPIYKQLLESDAGLQILVFSGDNDGVCGTIGTQEWIWDLGYSPVSREKNWKVWKYEDQVAGYATTFDVTTGTNNGFSFVTVHSAGHEVPAYVPAQALDLFAKYLSGYWFQKE